MSGERLQDQSGPLVLWFCVVTFENSSTIKSEKLPKCASPTQYIGKLVADQSVKMAATIIWFAFNLASCTFSLLGTTVKAGLSYLKTLLRLITKLRQMQNLV